MRREAADARPLNRTTGVTRMERDAWLCGGKCNGGGRGVDAADAAGLHGLRWCVEVDT